MSNLGNLEIVMAALTFNMQGYAFQEGVRVLIAAHETAADALREEWQRAKDNALAYQDGVESGETAWIGERDEEGHVIWDQDQVHEMEIDSKIEGQAAMRKAFILTLYHHWERSARIWTGSDKRDHDKLVQAVEAQGTTTHPKLAAVRDLANLLKHDNDKWGHALRHSWAAVFPHSFAEALGRTNWYYAIRLTDAHLTEAFNIVAASGPSENG